MAGTRLVEHDVHRQLPCVISRGTWRIHVSLDAGPNTIWAEFWVHNLNVLAAGSNHGAFVSI